MEAADVALETLSERAIAVCWERGELGYKLRPEQLVLKSDLELESIQLAVFNICRRFGKTFTLVLFVLEQCLRFKQKIRYGCAFLSELEEFVLPAFNLILEDCPQELKPKYLRSRKVWQFVNGSEIKLVGLDKNPNGLRGNAISKIVIDEAGFVTNLKSVYTAVIIPATAKQKNIKVIFSSTPPPTPDHFFIELADKAQSKSNGLYREMTIDQISDLESAEKERLLDEVGGKDTIAAQREFYCKLIVDQTIALAPEFNVEVHVKKLTEPKYSFYWVSGDTGIIRDLNVFHLVTYDFARNKILFLDERWFKPSIGTGLMVKSILEMEGMRSVTRPIDADARLRLDLANDHNFPTYLPRKDELEATVNQVRVTLQTRAVEIDPKCELLIRTLKNGTLNKNRTDLARTESLGHMDAFMSFAYGIRHVNTDNPYPAYGGALPHTHYIDPSTQNEAARGFQSLFRGPR